MPHNFRLTGISSPVYVSGDGNDGNPGTDPNLPKFTPARHALNNIIGTSDNKGAFSMNTVTSQVANYFADLLVKFNCTADFLANTSFNTTTVFNDDGNGRWWFDLNGFNLYMRGGGATFVTFKNAVIRNGTMATDNGFATVLYERCALEGIATSGLGLNQAFVFSKSKVFNSTISFDFGTLTGSEYSINETYIDPASTIAFSPYFSNPAAQFSNNNIQGVINVGGTPYELKREKDGTPINPNPGIADIITIDPTVYDRGNFSQSPQFVNLSKKDYWSVLDTSPHKGAGASGLNNIGDTYVTVGIKGTDPGFSSPEVLTDLVVSTGDYVYDTGAVPVFGKVRFPPILFSTVGSEMGLTFLAALLAYSVLEAVGGADNQNVPCVFDFLSGSAGANPQRLSYGMRFNTNITQPSADGDYDNAGFITAGDFFYFEHFNKPKVDTFGVGNGDPSFTPAGSSGIAPFWFQLEITLFEGLSNA